MEVMTDGQGIVIIVKINIMVEKIIKQGRKRKVKTAELGRRLIITKNKSVLFNSEGYEVHYCSETIEVLIGIGKDYCASLIMDTDAWEAFKSGEEIHISE